MHLSRWSLMPSVQFLLTARLFYVVLQARYILSDAAVKIHAYLVTGAALRMEGHVTVLCGGGACYRCMFPSPIRSGNCGSCDDGGVLGPLPVGWWLVFT